MIPFPLIGLIAAARFIRQITWAVDDRLIKLCNRYHLFEKAATAANAYSGDNKGFLFINDCPAYLSCVGRILPREPRKKRKAVSKGQDKERRQKNHAKRSPMRKTNKAKLTRTRAITNHRTRKRSFRSERRNSQDLRQTRSVWSEP
jgi:hypothetical protein